MNILYLGPHSSIVDYLRHNHAVTVYEGKLDPLFIGSYDFLISYGYRYILKPDVLNLFPDRAINLHISYLPWNRGADPNYWSWVDDTPKGVTIHHIDSGIDTGDIIAQQQVYLPKTHTLASSYRQLQHLMETMFTLVWPYIEMGTAPRFKQVGEGSFHLSKEKPELPNGWDTPVNCLRRRDEVLCHD